MKIEKEFNEEEFYRHVKKMLDYAKLKNLTKIVLKPCKSCGRVVYIGECCDSPDYEVEVIEEETK